MELREELAIFIGELPIISKERKYWLVRTQSGHYYETFRTNKFIAIEYDKIPYLEIEKLKKRRKHESDFNHELKVLVKKEYPKEKVPGLIASQLTKFIYEIKKDDIIVIPSVGAQLITIGRVIDTPLQIATFEEKNRTECNYTFRKPVDWLKTIDRSRLDPYLYKILFSHQAINDLNSYGELIERSLSDFFIKGDDANFVLELGESESDEISAKELFELTAGYLELLDSVSKRFELGVSSSDIEVKIYLNSPGKMQFKAPSWRSITLFAAVVVAVNGGGLKINNGGFGLDLSTPGIIKALSNYFNEEQDRQQQIKVYQQYKDSLHLKEPEDFINLLKQSSANKDIPK